MNGLNLLGVLWKEHSHILETKNGWQLVIKNQPCQLLPERLVNKLIESEYLEIRNNEKGKYFISQRGAAHHIIQNLKKKSKPK
jgi:hypothetical protein